MKKTSRNNRSSSHFPLGSTVGNLLQFNRFKKMNISSSNILTSVDRVLFIIDCPQLWETILQDIEYAAKIAGQDNIRLLSLESVIPQNDCPHYLTCYSLVGKGLTSSSDEFKTVIHTLQQFDATTCVIRTEKPHGAIRRLLLKLTPAKRIAFGSLPPYPLRNLAFPDFESLLSDYL